MNSARYIGVIEATSMSVRRYIELIGLRSCDWVVALQKYQEGNEKDRVLF